MRKTRKSTLTKDERKEGKQSDALKIINRITGDDPELREMIAEEKLNAHIAHTIYQARTKAGLTQKKLAERIGTQQPVIARLEDADYAGHSLTMLQRVAGALNQKVKISFVAVRGKRGPQEFARAL